MIGRKRMLHEPPSPTCINDLPNCLLVEIFLRLPLISAHHCKLVCKRWYSVTSEPYFADRFSQNEKLSSLLFHYYNYRDMDIYNCDSYSYHLNKEFSLDFMKPDVIIRVSSNDLLLCMAKPTATCCGDSLLCNPVTREWVHLPTGPRYQRRHTRYILFTSKKSGEFAVIRLIYFDDEFSNSIVLFLSSDTLEWVEKPFLPTSRIKRPFSSASNYAVVPDKGEIFWYESSDEVIIGFDPFNVSAKSSWLFIDPPKEFIPRGTLNYSWSEEYLGVCRKTLRFCQISGEIWKDDCILRVWDLKGQAEWILYGHALLQNEEIKHEDGAAIEVIACHPNDPDIIYLAGVLTIDRMFLSSFNISTGEMKKLHPIPPHESRYLFVVNPFTVQWRPTPLPRFKD